MLGPKCVLILTKNQGSGSLNQKNASHQFIWALLMLETQYLVKLESLGVEKKWCGNFRNFEILPLFWPFLGQNFQKMPILTQKWPKKGQNVKISKIQCILFWGPLRSTLCPKISLFNRFGLEFGTLVCFIFEWFS